ncbi:MAG: AlkZ family DNA glycosylase [Archangiaceae bacterium]|nr:AlkZ family DNA glycosylase [Archangiaceae bacterium]
MSALGAVQAQDWLASRWALGVRLAGQVTEADVESEGVVRMHALRGTWQLVALEDVRWMLGLVGELEVKAATSRHRGLGLDEKVFAKSHRALEAALRDGPRSRAELRVELGRQKLPVASLMHLLWEAELRGVICTGVKRDTYALFDARIPRGRVLARDEAAAELARRYVQTRGPATLRDFTWWSGLSAAEAKRAFPPSPLAGEGRGEGARTARGSVVLLPAFDEYLIAYANRYAMLDPAYVKRLNAGGGLLNPCVVVDGRVVGTWSRTLKAKRVEVTVRWFSARYDVEAAAQRYAAFLSRELVLRE